MAHLLTGLDHTVLAAHDLEAARQTYARLGFTLTPRGRHIGWATGNYCIMFPGNYIELLGIADAGGYTAGLEEILRQRGEGVHKIVLGSRDAAATRASLLAAGIAASEVQSLKRALELPGGNVLPAFSLVHLPPEATPDVSAFVCQHLTPDLLRQPDWLLHPNGAIQLAGVVIACDDPGSASSAYERLFGGGSTVQTDHLVTARIGDEYLLFARPDDLSSLFPDIDHDPTRPTPYVAGMRLRVHNPEAAAMYFRAAGVPYEQAIDGAVLVTSEAAHGCFLEFSGRG